MGSGKRCTVFSGMSSCNRMSAARETLFPSLASQEERLTVIPGITTTEEIEKLTSENSAVVIMKLSRCTDEIHRCIRLYPEYRYHYFENVGTPEEKYINDSKRIATIRFPYFSLLIIRTETF